MCKRRTEMLVAARYVRILLEVLMPMQQEIVLIKRTYCNGVRRHVPVSYISVAELKNINARRTSISFACNSRNNSKSRRGKSKQLLKVIPTWDTGKLIPSKLADILVKGTF